MSRFLIVEGKEDKEFLSVLLANQGHDSGFEILSAGGLTEIGTRIEQIKRQFPKSPNISLAIILDQDDATQEERLRLCNDALAALESQISLSNLNTIETFPKADGGTWRIGVFLVEVNGRGSLDDYLLHIRSRATPYADCLDNWAACVEGHERALTPKELKKLKIDVLCRWDALTRQERESARENAKLESFLRREMENPVFINLEHPILNPLKSFIDSFCA